MKYSDKFLEDFMHESNSIEGEGKNFNHNDLKSITYVVENSFKSLEDFLKVHGWLTEHVKDKKFSYYKNGALYEFDLEWSGKWRTHNVRVGKYIAPPSKDVPGLMEIYMEFYDSFSAIEAHDEFEMIHPFSDFNGRMGRLVWLDRFDTIYQKKYDFTWFFLENYILEKSRRKRKPNSNFWRLQEKYYKLLSKMKSKVIKEFNKR